jgi:hypothetical protein
MTVYDSRLFKHTKLECSFCIFIFTTLFMSVLDSNWCSTSFSLDWILCFSLFDPPHTAVVDRKVTPSVADRTSVATTDPDPRITIFFVFHLDMCVCVHNRIIRHRIF